MAKVSADDKIVLGINTSHDMACAAIVGGEVVVAIAEERLNRVKHCTGATQFGRIIPYRAIRYCCDYLGVDPREVDLFVVNSCRSNARAQLAAQLIGIPDERVAELPHPGHHLAHAYSALYCSPFDEAAVMVVDTNGSFIERPGTNADSMILERKEHYACYRGDGDGLRLVHAEYVHPGEVSIGELYCIYSAALQLTPKEGPYGFDCPLSAGGKLMGLASHDLGRTPAPDLWPAASAEDGDIDGRRLAIRLERLVQGLAGRGFVTRHEPGLEGVFGFSMRRFVDLEQRSERSLDDPRYLALAGEAQRALEQALLEIGARLQRQGLPDLCLAGGTMLNVTACTRMLDELAFERLFVQPAANDAGNAIGAGLYGYRELLGGRRRPYLDRAYDTCLGRHYAPEQIERAIERGHARASFSARRVDSLDRRADALMPHLLGDRIVAVFEGRSEFGPRALGHRSLIASPRQASMRERMNQLKRREWYRPVAPAILAEDFADYFSAPFHEVPHMTLSARCKPIVAERAPAVRHVDGTARPQTVTAEQSPLLYELLVRIKRETSTPILIDTSFNLDGEPIVETPDDAVDAFLRAPLCDCLCLGEFVLEKPGRALGTDG